MRVLVCGGRDFTDRDRLWAVLDKVHAAKPITLLIHGRARGADTLGGEWAADRGVPVQEFPADWKTYGNRAGPRRNQQMLDEAKPEVVVAAPGGTGTRDMTSRARQANVPIVSWVNR